MLTSASRAPFTRRTLLIALLLAAAAFALRYGYLVLIPEPSGVSPAAFAFADPDRYMENGARLATPQGGFRWTFESVYYPWGGRLYTLPPLYPFVLGLVASFPGYPYSAAIGQIVLSSLTVLTLVLLGARAHSPGAGLAAGALQAIWGNSIIATGSFMQERLYVPLIALAFLALVRAFDGSRRPARFFAAGALLGLSALCRSMPTYFVAAVAIGHVAFDRDRRLALREAAGLVAGFALLTVPYSVALSMHLGHPTFIEDHGGLVVAHRFGAPSNKPPGLVTIAATLVEEFLRSPTRFTTVMVDGARSMFHANGGRFLEQGVNAPTESAALAWKYFAHLSIDLPYVVTLLLAIPGAVLMRDRAAAALFAAWIVLNVALVAITGFGGARLRAPFEPHLMVMAGAVLAGGWRKPSRLGLAGAAAVVLVAALAVLPHVPRVLRARGNYGVQWAVPEPPHVATIRQRGGFNALLQRGGVLALRFHNDGDTPESVRVWLQGNRIADIEVAARSDRQLRMVEPDLQFVFVEVEPQNGGPIRVDVPWR
jgi:Dolichyl-phosphate-mannose-protein mannosyltransferase